jgi:hypothetical protein
MSISYLTSANPSQTVETRLPYEEQAVHYYRFVAAIFSPSDTTPDTVLPHSTESRDVTDCANRTIGDLVLLVGAAVQGRVESTDFV